MESEFPSVNFHPKEIGNPIRPVGWEFIKIPRFAIGRDENDNIMLQSTVRNNATFSPEERERRRKIIEAKFDNTDIFTPVSAMDDFKFTPPAIPKSPKVGFDVTEKGANGVVTSTYGIIDGGKVDAIAASLELGFIGEVNGWLYACFIYKCPGIILVCNVFIIVIHVLYLGNSICQ